MVQSEIIVGISVTSFIAGLLIVILVPLHFSYVERNQYAFKKNTATNDVDRTATYPNGRYGWGVGKAPVTFPSDYQLLSFTGRDALSVFVEGGQTIYVPFEIMYRILREKLPQLYEAFGTSYHSRITSIARARLRNTAPQFTLDDYLSSRANVSAAFLADLIPELASKAFVETSAEYFFMYEIQLPTALLSQRNQIFTISQAQITQQYAQTATLTRLTTTSQVASIDGEVSVVAANATAAASAATQSAAAEAFAIVQAERGNLLNSLVTQLGLSRNSTSQLLYYLSILDDGLTTVAPTLGVNQSVAAKSASRIVALGQSNPTLFISP